jgi:hypothetical protein
MEKFRACPVTVADVTGQPASSVEITMVSIPTGAVREPVSLGTPETGRYVVAADGAVVRVTGHAGDASHRADTVFAVPEPCCRHVIRMSLGLGFVRRFTVKVDGLVEG